MRFRPDWAQRAVVIERAGAVFADTFVELDGTVNCFNDFEQGNILRLAGKCHAAACATRSVQQPGNGQLRNDLGKEGWRNVLLFRD